MDRFSKFSAWFVAATIMAVILVVLCAGFGFVPGPVLILLLAAAYAWMLFAFFHYRQCRQEEFLQAVTAAAAVEAPLASAVWAYLQDRPRGPLREFLVALLLFFVFPGYYWLWYLLAKYDRKLD